MQPKNHTKLRHVASPVTLYLEELEAIEEAASRNNFICEFGDRDHIFRDLNELREKKSVAPDNIEINLYYQGCDRGFSDVAIRLMPGQLELTAARFEQAMMLWDDIRRIIDHRETTAAHFYGKLRDSTFDSTVLVPTIVVGGSYFTYWATGSPAISIIIAIILMAFSIGLAVKVSLTYPRVRLVRSDEARGFWKRNWESIVVALVSAATGAVLYGLARHIME